MRTPNLIKCIECGRDASIFAETCPACSSAAFRGVPCEICRETLRERDALQVGPSGEYAKYYHHACLQQFFTVTASVRCSDCGASLSDVSADAIARSEAVCSQCGSHYPFGQLCCSHCGLPFISGLHKKLGILMRHSFCEKFHENYMRGLGV
jgi:DNA-directed RNA polymerase subunit RPC12/RpoP